MIKIPLDKNDYPLWNDIEVTLEKSFEQAVNIAPVHIRYFNICGHTLQLCFAGVALIEILTGALNHHAISELETPPDLIIYIWDSYSTGVPIPEIKLNRLGRYLDPEQKWRVAAERWPDYLTASNRNSGFMWVNSADSYPIDRYATPLRSTLLWWLAGYGLHGLHAAAVGYNGKAALLLGNGGAGKSTTSLLCLQAGLNYLGDDIVIFEKGIENKEDINDVYCLYSSAKVNTLGANCLSTRSVAIEPSDRQRAVHFLYPSYQQSISLSLPIHALIVLSLSDNNQTEFKPIQSATAFAILAPSTHRVLSIAISTQTVTLPIIAELTRSISCYKMNLGRNLETIPVAIRSLLEVSN